MTLLTTNAFGSLLGHMFLYYSFANINLTLNCDNCAFFAV